MPLKLSLLLLAAVVLLVAPAASEATTTAQRASENRTFTELQRAVRQRVDSHNSPGIVAGMLFPDGRTRVFAYDRIRGTRLDADSVFEIGSITKVFTGTLLADMAQRGEVALDQPVATLLPPAVKVPSRHGRQITLADLATHTSGLPRDPTNITPKDPTRPWADYTEQQLYALLKHTKLTRDPGTSVEYSNVGAGLLGHALALRAGSSYEQLVRERIVDRLGMKETAVTLTPSMARRFVATEDLFGFPAAPFEIPTLAGAGALRSTMTDMLRFARANLAGSGDAELDRAMALARAPRMAITDGERIGLHWITDSTPGRDIVWHDGGTLGHHTFLGLDPKRRMAVVILSGSKIDINDIGFHVLDRRAPLQAMPKAVTVPARTLDRYTGVYAFPGLRVRIGRGPRGLVAHSAGVPPLRLRAESPTRFFLNMAVRLRFKLGKGRKATGAVLSLQAPDLVGRRVG